MAGIPIIIPTNREGLKRWLKLVGIILVAVAIYLTATKIQFTQPNFVKEGTVPISEMNKNDVYEIKDVVLLDNYATYTSNSYEYEYFTVLIADNDESSKYASIVTSVKDGDVYQQMIAFKNDLSLNYGECILNGCFRVDRLDDIKMKSDNRTELKKYFQEDIDDLQQMINVDSSDLVLKYACAAEADFAGYQESVKNENIKWAGISAALVAGGIIMFLIGVSMSKKDKKRAAAEAALYTPEETDCYYQPTMASPQETPAQTEILQESYVNTGAAEQNSVESNNTEN